MIYVTHSLRQVVSISFRMRVGADWKRSVKYRPNESADELPPVPLVLLRVKIHAHLT